MKKIVLTIAVILVLGGLYLIFKNSTINNPTVDFPTLTNSPTEAQIPFCEPTNLQGSLTTEGAAGSIYGALTLKNISTIPCQIQGDQFITATTDVKNITVVQQGTIGATIMLLTPNQTVYSQVRYQNGPQCSSPTKQSAVTFNYPISAANSVAFQNENGNTQQTVQTCNSPSEMTTIDVWSISNQRITSQ